ncbi:polyketide biosynthesis enoyl-CoA hydratase PksI [Amycolatopsis arida]|uniref:Polyketide biosynthesis enoyl-CoA hydratase PksI n=1 Tax=Amycolatopsis arida TaxID=587909 RepID=A0A1I6AK79_9PSEU|nr:polyketide synthase [Amycolatopsis arida]TDX87343.1 polyketide biosynthesis enoyl-CoA hydratase PksI [Amycolatopsis arida]SFQ69096.1 polyketide biosynthesis enoyl-CoA hydratase PksI [Amycolatopsis arida]
MSATAGPVSVRVDRRVALVTMADEAGRNALSPTLTAALRAALDRAVADPAVRVVVVTGTPAVFATGASREYLLRPERENVEPAVRAFLRCPLPVVAAMRGHALGGGLTQGLYADLPVLSERSYYAANYLNYGLVPEYGTTWLLPAKLGPVLGTELLYTARGYRGAELRDRGAPLRVTGHDRVLPEALDLARGIARAPRSTVELLKQQLATQTLARSDAAIAAESGPHERSWHSAEFHRLVRRRYGDAEEIAR